MQPQSDWPNKRFLLRIVCPPTNFAERTPAMCLKPHANAPTRWRNSSLPPPGESRRIFLAKFVAQSTCRTRRASAVRYSRSDRSHIVTAADFRRIALSLEDVEEYSHGGLPAFRAGTAAEALGRAALMIRGGGPTRPSETQT